MNSGRIGSILVLISGAIVVAGALFILIKYGDESGAIKFIISMFTFSAVAIVSAILGFKDKKVGGWLALIAGIVWLVGSNLCLFANFCFISILSIFGFTIIDIGLIYFGTVELALAIIGGILILVSKND